MLAIAQLGYITAMESERSPLWLLRNVSRGAARLTGKLDFQGPRAAGGGRGSQRCIDWPWVVVPGGLLFL